MPPGPSEFPDLPEPPALSPFEERLLVEAAIRSIHAFCEGLGEDDLSTVWSSTGEASGAERDVRWPGQDQPLPVLPGLCQRSGVFVTIFQGDDLRGCLGLTHPSESLLEAVPRMAHAASSRDTRFQPIDARDLPDLRVELTFLGPMTRLPSSPTVLLERLDPRVCGVYIRFRGRAGLLLPQVARRYSWTAGELLEQVCRKAGVPSDAWRSPDAEILGFRARSTEPIRVRELPGPGKPGASEADR